MTITTFLMFQDGQAEPAMEFYRTVFADSAIESMERFGPDDGAAAGQVKQAILRLGATRYRVFDSPIKHAFTFTPAISIFVDTDSVEQLDGIAAKLLDGGAALMPPDNYGFSARFAWIQDRFGISWQLNAAFEELAQTTEPGAADKA